MLAVTVVFNYASNLAWSHGDSRTWPYVLATSFFAAGLVWCVRAPKLSPGGIALLLIASVVAYLVGGFFVGLFCSCAMGDCL